MRRAFYRALGLDEIMDQAELSYDDVDLLLNRSFWEIMLKFKFREKEVLATFPVIIGERSYEIPSPFEALQSLSINDLDENFHLPLGRITAEVYEKRYDQDVDARGKPTHYVREGCGFKLWPTPDKAYILTMRRWITLTDISESNVHPNVPRDWHEPILFGGIYRGFLDRKDFAAANTYKAYQNAAINTMIETETKEKGANTSLSGLDVAWGEYGPLGVGADGGRI